MIVSLLFLKITYILIHYKLDIAYTLKHTKFMFRRNIYKDLKDWKASSNRKPLILRGARQTGKTTLIKLFSQEFEQVISLNLELSADRRIWQGEPSIDELLRNIEIVKGVQIIPGKTLLFIDEIQNEPKAIQSLRYFYEEKKELHVIATGSLMEVVLQNKGFSFPVGRVSFLYLYPVSFFEFLEATGKQVLLEELKNTFLSALSPSIHALALEKFYEYIFVGGMPEVVQRFIDEKSYLPLKMIKEALLSSFEEEVPKYCSAAQVPYVQLLIREAPLFAGQRIQYTNFAESGYKNREMKRAFEILEQAMIVQRIFGTPLTQTPLISNPKVSPKLCYLDVGLIAHRLSLDFLTLQKGELNDLFRGSLAEQVVCQELMAQNSLRREVPFFWYRDKVGATSEVDYCLNVKGLVIPVEVKSGKTGTLKSLHQFMEQAPHTYALRIYSGPLQKDELTTPSGKKYQLLSLPFYLLGNVINILERFVDGT